MYNNLTYSEDNSGVADGFGTGSTHFAKHYFVAVGMCEQEAICFVEGFGCRHCRHCFARPTGRCNSRWQWQVNPPNRRRENKAFLTPAPPGGAGGYIQTPRRRALGG